MPKFGRKDLSQTRAAHLKKLETITARHKSRLEQDFNLRPEGISKWVVNMFSRKLSSAEEEILHLGLNFAPTPSRLPLIDIVAAIEEGANKLEDDAPHDF